MSAWVTACKDCSSKACLEIKSIGLFFTAPTTCIACGVEIPLHPNGLTTGDPIMVEQVSELRERLTSGG